MSEVNQNQKKQLKPVESLREAAKLINSYLVKLQVAVNIEMKPERIGIYVQELSGLSERQIHFAFDRALKQSRWIPALPELLTWAHEGAEMFQREDAAARTKLITSREDKPEDWPNLNSVWAQIERRADEQERLDLAYVEPFADEYVEFAVKIGKGYPGDDRYVDWLSRKEARDRHSKGIPRPRSRKQYGPMLESAMSGNRKPGAGAEEAL